MSLIIWDHLPKFVYECESTALITETIAEFNER